MGVSLLSSCFILRLLVYSLPYFIELKEAYHPYQSSRIFPHGIQQQTREEAGFPLARSNQVLTRTAAILEGCPAHHEAFQSLFPVFDCRKIEDKRSAELR